LLLFSIEVYVTVTTFVSWSSVPTEAAVTRWLQRLVKFLTLDILSQF
jgi:hypothetical protein